MNVLKGRMNRPFGELWYVVVDFVVNEDGKLIGCHYFPKLMEKIT